MLVRSDLKGHGLGRAMMHRLITYARDEGIDRLDGLVLRENARMMTLCRELGFDIADEQGDPTLVRAVLPLRRA